MLCHSYCHAHRQNRQEFAAGLPLCLASVFSLGKNSFFNRLVAKRDVLLPTLGSNDRAQPFPTRRKFLTPVCTQDARPNGA
mmetsp:Transcript_109559/g.283206  ORF Transcript_109559/g.283206 Transcript_109559/m.283206 type:complete len:81 (-) Transcript_109559:30-272(-)